MRGPVMSVEFLKEVEEDIHREEWIQFWKNYGLVIGGVVLATLLAAGGYLWWRSSEQAALEADSARYESILSEMLHSGPSPSVQKSFQDLVSKGRGGYPLLAQIQLYRIASGGSNDPQIDSEGEALLAKVRGSRESGFEGAIVLNLAYRAIDGGRELPAVVRDSLKLFEMPQNPWKGLALEVQALEAVQNKQLDQAQKIYNTLLTSTDVIQGVHTRAGLEVIGAHLSLPLSSR